MNSELQVQAYTEADFSSSDQQLTKALDCYMKELGRVPDRETLFVDIGCGPGKITELLSEYWPYSTVLGIDGSLPMIRVARSRKFNENNLQKYMNINYFHMEIREIALGKSKLDSLGDVLVSNSVLHHIHDPNEFWLSIKKLSAPGSVQFHKDLRRPKSIQDAEELQRKYLLEAPTVLKDDFLASLKAAFTAEEVRDQLVNIGLSNLNVSEVDDRYLQIVGTINE